LSSQLPTSTLFPYTTLFRSMLENREGQRVPQVQFQVRADGEWKTVTTDDLFKGKTVVVFSLPGAYTPTCSSTHLPRFEEMTPTLDRKSTRLNSSHVKISYAV